MISIKLDDTKAIKVIDEIAKQLKQPRKLYGELGEELRKQHQTRIKKEMAPDGKKWKPLQSWYKKTKKRGGILRATGELHNTLAYNIGADSLEFGSPVKYAPTHQFGAVIIPKRKKALALQGGELGFAKKVNVPSRPWLGVSEDDITSLEQRAIRHLNKMLERLNK
ncbi:phage virion morphogenesis protein [Gallibacterium anatis]|uniref:Phage virion morphogenesis protein n=1 Tax=Gallibacterium anatis TaxID=750 RepID=A0A0A2XML6_9PAST|nr:phage virion morphogenesis protein [Gallibacterium anatis]KGQ31920.1 hypothetical protein JP32_06030 [Gallibacterium anatis]